MNLPDFLCIGAQKAGTTWLRCVLSQHPHVFMPPINELHYFDRYRKPVKLRTRQIDLAERALRRERKRQAVDQDYVRYLEHLLSFSDLSREWYEAAYSWPVADGVRKGDITPRYLEVPAPSVAYARELLGPVKLILIVRHPTDRLLSQVRMWAARDDRSDVPRDDEEWMDLLDQVAASEPRGSYRRGIKRWRSHFGAENLLVLPFSEMRTDPRGFLAQIEDHLDIARHDGYEDIETRRHASLKIPIPECVVEAAAALTAEETAYIEKKFGQEFLAKTR